MACLRLPYCLSSCMLSVSKVIMGRGNNGTYWMIAKNTYFLKYSKLQEKIMLHFIHSRKYMFADWKKDNMLNVKRFWTSHTHYHILNCKKANHANYFYWSWFFSFSSVDFISYVDEKNPVNICKIFFAIMIKMIRKNFLILSLYLRNIKFRLP